MERNLNCTSAIIVRDGKILLGERKKKSGTGHDSSFWYTPGGRCEGNETPEQTVLREIKEEIGITDAQIVTKLLECRGVFEDKHGRDILHVFLVTITGEPKLMEPEKFLGWQWFGLEELPENLIDRERDIPMFEKAISEAEKLVK